MAEAPLKYTVGNSHNAAQTFISTDFLKQRVKRPARSLSSLQYFISTLRVEQVRKPDGRCTHYSSHSEALEVVQAIDPWKLHLEDPIPGVKHRIASFPNICNWSYSTQTPTLHSSGMGSHPTLDILVVHSILCTPRTGSHPRAATNSTATVKILGNSCLVSLDCLVALPSRQLT